PMEVFVLFALIKKMIVKSDELKKILSGRRKPVLMLIDLFIMVVVYTVLTIMYNGSVMLRLNFVDKVVNFAILVAFLFILRLISGIYSSVWRYARSYSYLKLIIADIISCIFYIAFTRLMPWTYTSGWHSVTVVCVITLGTLASRFVYQQIYSKLKNGRNVERDKINVAIIGAGRVGTMLAEELRVNENSRYKPYVFIDKDPEKVGNRISGIRVIGAQSDVLKQITSMPIGEIIIATPDLDGETKQRLYNFYSQSGLPIKIYDYAFGKDSSEIRDRRIRNIKIDDLLFREPVMLVENISKEYYKNKRVLVTGGGGSIGSEICRQIARCSPEQLIIVDIYENNAYDIQQELFRAYGDELKLAIEVASVRDRDRIDDIFSHYKPEIVFHAAAHKHVPLMEHNGCEAIKNNIIGTYNTADMAEKYSAEKFILISTDKAVNPTSIMGASKRMCEMIVQSRHDSKTSFAAVRFGNVLGSNGSVIPLFKKQIEDGGPITVTDKRIIRYFMTIPEAAQLVMHAGMLAKRGELFILDMGKPVKIVELAENMIRLSGLVPYTDIDIVEIGLRPGEKLYEELLIKSEKLSVTENKMIFIEKDTPFTRGEVDDKLETLRSAMFSAETTIESVDIKEALQSVVPDFRDPEEVNKDAYNSDEMKLAEMIV
ncbi:MAG: nucleoside-diphosphate sugar epimerase/dehydratase, partial [Eubacteriales bacterium]|nr:nucleoside-diphosphate sugar epimerase/dehydratase [Eubacteriales bacterium]